MVKMNNLPLDSDMDTIMMSYVFSDEDDNYERLYIRGKAPRNVSLDDHIQVILRNNSTMNTIEWEVIYSDLQYNKADETKSDTPLLAYHVSKSSRYLNGSLTDIRDIKYTAYLSMNRVIYIALRRPKQSNANDSTSMKDTLFSGEILGTNVHVTTNIYMNFVYRPVATHQPEPEPVSSDNYAIFDDQLKKILEA